MGSLISLSVGMLEVDWGKNFSFRDHSPIFQRDDIKDIPYYYVGNEEAETIFEMKEGYSSPLSKVIQRLALLGYTAEGAKEAFENLLAEFEDRFKGAQPLTFENLRSALINVDVTNVSPDYRKGLDLGELFSSEIFDRLELGKFVNNQHDARYNVDDIMENIHPYWLLCILGENPNNLVLPVNWSFADIAEEWTGRDIFVHELSTHSKFLIVTEGSSDAHIIQKAISILRPQIADFFRFVDMEDGYPFTGTGNLYKFCQGLVSISIQNKVLIVYDNDAEGKSKYNETARLHLPDNMRVMKLPLLTEFEKFSTVGPSGSNQENINERAAAIECYLDLSWQAKQTPIVRWTNYKTEIGEYQGSLIDKEHYCRQFMKLRGRETSYDFSKIEVVLNSIVTECIKISNKLRQEET